MKTTLKAYELRISGGLRASVGLGFQFGFGRSSLAMKGTLRQERELELGLRGGGLQVGSERRLLLALGLALSIGDGVCGEDDTLALLTRHFGQAQHGFAVLDLLLITTERVIACYVECKGLQWW